MLGLPVDRVRITDDDGAVFGERFVEVTITDLTQAQETEVSAFFDDNDEFTLPSVGSVFPDGPPEEVAKPNVTLQLIDVCTSVPADGVDGNGFPDAEYIAAFNNVLGGTVTTSIGTIIGESQDCADATPEGSTQVITDIEVPAADLGAVLALLPLSSNTIDLGGDFGVVSLGERLDFFS